MKSAPGDFESGAHRLDNLAMTSPLRPLMSIECVGSRRENGSNGDTQLQLTRRGRTRERKGLVANHNLARNLEVSSTFVAGSICDHGEREWIDDSVAVCEDDVCAFDDLLRLSVSEQLVSKASVRLHWPGWRSPSWPHTDRGGIRRGSSDPTCSNFIASGMSGRPGSRPATLACDCRQHLGAAIAIVEPVSLGFVEAEHGQLTVAIGNEFGPEVVLTWNLPPFP